MKYNNRIRIFAGCFFCITLLSGFACNKGDSKDPATVDLGEFNPPGLLQSLTRSNKLVLTWIGANAESDFKGYHVFGTTKTIAELDALVGFPSGAKVSEGASVPRCEDNNDFFAAFGFPESTATCESNVADAAASLMGGSDASISQSAQQPRSQFLLDEAAAEEEALTIDFNVGCTATDQAVEDNTLSLAASSDGTTVGRVFCDVEQVYDTTTSKLVDIANGTTYTYLVVAVKGSDNNEISWISNVISDTPAHSVFSDTITIATQKYRLLTIDSDTFAAATIGTATACASDICELGTSSAGASTGIYIARDDDNSNIRQRIFVSTKSGSSIKLQARGNQTWTDPRDNSILDQKPDDTAQTSYAAAGTTFAVFGNQVFDVQITKDTNSFVYGKLAITNLTMATATSKTSDATLDVTLVLQPQLNSVDYLH